MNRNNDQISSAQLAAILATTMMSIGILSLPRALVEKVGPDALIVLTLGVVLTVFLGIIIAKLSMKFPKETIVEFSQTLLGRFLGIAMSLGFFLYLIFLVAIEARLFGEIMKTYLLINTPIEVLMITFLLGVIYVVRCGVEAFARMAQIIFPIVLFSSVITMVPLLPELDLSHFLPFFKTPILEIIKALPVMFFSFLGLELTLVFSAFVIDKKNIGKFVSFSVILIGFIYFNTTVVTVARFGLEETTHIIWPALEIFKTVDIPGAFIENIYIYTIAIWIFSVLMTAVAFYLASAIVFSRIIKSIEINYLTLPLLPIIYFLALIPDGLAQAIEMMDIFTNYIGTFFLIIVPIVLLGVSIFKKGKGAKKNA